MKKQGKIEWPEILFWIVMIILFVMILTRIFGNSATEIQIYIGFMTIFVSIMIFIAKHYRETGEIKRDMKHNFFRVREDFIKIREDINRIETKIDNLSLRKK